MPPYALLVAAVVPALIVIGSKFSTDALTKIISFAALGIYIGFQMVVLAALRARLKGWMPAGSSRSARWGMPVNVGRPGLRRAGDGQHGVAAHAGRALVRQLDRRAVGRGRVGVGLVYMVLARPYEHSEAISGDAVHGMFGQPSDASGAGHER